MKAMACSIALAALVACSGHQGTSTEAGGTAPAPSASGTGAGGGGGGGDATGTGGGATLAGDLTFAVVGDTRPPSENDISGYPTSIITSIYADIAKRDPLLVVGTGDYQFSSTSGSQASDQMDLYMKARAQYAGPFYPAMGNHECTGSTNSNCGTGNADGVTANYTAFLTKMLAPIAETEPYYVVHVNAKDASWTAKFVVFALNAWTTAQATWLDEAMSEATTYTFIVHHEPASETAAPGQAAAQAILAKHPYTLALVGHTHTYRKPFRGSKEVIIGNGGAPATSGSNYGYALFQRRTDGAIAADMIDYQSGQPTTGESFVMTADGTQTQ